MYVPFKAGLGYLQVLVLPVENVTSLPSAVKRCSPGFGVGASNLLTWDTCNDSLILTLNQETQHNQSVNQLQHFVWNSVQLVK